MSFETAADAFIRPTVGPIASPAHGAAPGGPAASAQQAAGRSDGATNERGARAEHETAAGEFDFSDLLDVINPLQHIPFLADAYRAVTGDDIKPPAQVLGGLLFGGPIGFVAAAANAVVKESSGRDIGDAALALLFGDEAAPADVASATPGATGLETALAAQVEPAAGPEAGPGAGPRAGRAATAYTPVAGGPPPASPFAAAARAAMPADQGAEDAAAAAVAQAMGASSGPALTGKAALNAFLDDLAAVGRKAAGRPVEPAPPPAAEEVAARVDGKATTTTTAGAEARPSRKEGNLIGLGSRDRRPSARRAPAVVVPAARLIGAAGAAGNAPRIISGAAPRVPAAAALDPTIFPAGASGTAPDAIPSPPGAEVAVPNDFSERMMRALQKYETLLDEQPGAASDPS